MGNPGAVTQTKPSPNMMFPSAFVKPRPIVAMTLLVLGSIRATFPSARERTQIEFSAAEAPPNAIETGSGVTSIRATTRLVRGLMRRMRFCPGQATQSELSANVIERQLAARRTSETIALLSGSMRVRVVLSSVNIQTLSALDAIARGAAPVPVLMEVTGFPVPVSSLARECDPQFTTHRLRKALTAPPHGLEIPAKGSSTLLDRPSTRTI